MGLATFVTVMLLSTAASARRHTSPLKSRVQTGNARILTSTGQDFPFSMFGDVSQAIPSSAAIAEMLDVKPDDLRLIVLGWILPLIFYGALFYAKRAVSTLPMKANGSSTTTNEIAEKACKGSPLSNEDDPATPEAPWTPPQSSSLASSSECSTPPLGSSLSSSSPRTSAWRRSHNECLATRLQHSVSVVLAANRAAKMASSASNDSSSSTSVAPNGERAPSCRDSPVALKKGQRIHSDLDASAAHLMAATHPSDPARKVLSANLRAFQRAGVSVAVACSVLDRISSSLDDSRFSGESSVTSTSSASTKHAKRRLEFGKDNLHIPPESSDWVRGLRTDRPLPGGKPAWE